MEIPGFEMLQKLGAGGMATVWKARQVSLDRIVAIKILSSRLAHDADDVRRFQTEAQAAAKLKHPGIIQVYDANVERDTYYFVMEYVAGYTVGDWVRRKGRLDEKDALLVAQCVADALEYAWERESIIHCDIKPDNIIIDSDGAVKIADLGLARTISAMAGQAVSDEVLGTPAYLSPEQALGRLDLDCASDIYSLGAMLYHLLTGTMLFEGKSDEEVMESQVSGSVPDPTEKNPQLSQSVCWLMEKMLVKDREHRYRDWPSVKADIDRVRKKLPLHGRPKAGTSTITRRKIRTAGRRRTAFVAAAGAGAGAAREKADQPASGPKGIPGPAIAAIVAGALVAGVVLMAVLSGGRNPDPGRVVVGPPPVRPPAGGSDDNGAREQQLKDAFEGAQKWAAEHPDDIDEAVQRFRKLTISGHGTRYVSMAEGEIRELSVKREAAIKSVMDFLVQKSEYMVQRGMFGDAAAVYEGYDGRLAQGSRMQRMAIAARYRAEEQKVKDEAARLAAQAEEKLADFYDEVALNLTRGGVPAAMDALRTAKQDPVLAAREKDLDVVRQILDDAAGVDVRIMNSFRAQQGKEIVVALTEGKLTLTIVAVKDDGVSATLQIGRASVKKSFGVEDLSMWERLQRMGNEDDPGVPLAKGLMALQSRAYPQARAYFEKVAPPISARLLARLDAIEGENGAVTPPRAVPAAEERPVESAAEKAPEAVAVRRAPAGPAAPREMVLEQLLDFNPGLQPTEIRLDADAAGNVHAAEMFSPGVRNLGPLARLTALRRVSCGARGEPLCMLVDVSPLADLPLESLNITFCPIASLLSIKDMQLEELGIRGCAISDLSFVRRMPLKKLDVSGTRIRDLTLLKGMKLADLNCSATRVADLRPLSGMALKSLDISGCAVRDISWLKGMPLERLNLSQTKTHTYTVLNGMPLASFAAAETQFRDLSVLDGAALKHLDLRETGVKDLDVLKGMPLERLVLSKTLVRDLAPLAGAPLKHLELAGCGVEDLAPLVGAPLEHLDLSDTQVSDLSTTSLRHIRHLNINGSRVSDLAPLEGSPITWLDCRGSRARNLAPLKRSAITDLWADSPDEEVLRVMPKLRSVNGAAWNRWGSRAEGDGRGRRR